MGMKIIELNWAIEKGDLAHRLAKIKGFLEEGRRVEVVLAKKKGGRRATVEECEALIDKIHECVESVPGSKSVDDQDQDAAKVPQKLGGYMTFRFLGKEQKSEREPGQDLEQDDEKKEE